MAYILDPADEMRNFLTRFDYPSNQFLNETLCDEVVGKRNLLKEFMIGKRGEGCSVNTLGAYFQTLKDFLWHFKDVPLSELRGSDIKEYLITYQATRNISNSTLDNMRRNLNSFFTYLVIEDYLDKNPMLKIHKIKSDSIIKMPFSEEELERIRDACGNIRELALIDFLYSTGVRVSECVNADIGDFNMLHPALFVRPTPPFIRVSKPGVEYMVRMIGQRAHVTGCHPHRFRRTLATRLLERGMPIEQVQAVLGHTKIDTTLLYARVNQQNVKLNHSRYV